MTMVVEKPLISSKLVEKKFSLQFLPKRLEDITPDNVIIYDGFNLKKSYLVDIVHNLILRYYFRKENYYSLSSLILKEKYGHRYNKYIDFLLDNRIIFLVKQYFNGRNTRVYKLNPCIFEEKISRYKNTDTILLKKYKFNIESIVDNTELKNNIEQHIKVKLVQDLFSIDIDYERAICFLDSTIQERDVYNKNKYSIDTIKDKHIFYHFDIYGRLHTNFTILKSFIRKNCLTIDGEELVEIDIKNSQPLFLTKISEKYDVNQYELDIFKYLTWNGLFYQFILNKSLFLDKKEVKTMTYKVFFGKNYANKYDSLFYTLFPSIYKTIRDFKKEADDYRSLSHKLQSMESNFIFNKVIKRIYTLYPEIKLFTVHDSIIFPKKYYAKVKEIFDQELEIEFIGYRYIAPNI